MAALKTLWKTTLTATETTDDEGVGRIRIEGNDIYRWVQNKNATALTVGQVCYHKAADAANAHEKVYDLSTAGAANASLMAGIVMAASLAADSFGWIQIWGVNASVSMYASGVTAVAAGDTLKGDSSGGFMVHDAGFGDVSQTQEALTDNSGGVTSTTLAAMTPTSTYNSANLVTLNNGIASLAAQLAKVKVDVEGVITSKSQGRNVIAMAALASSVTVATAGRGFVRCL